MKLINKSLPKSEQISFMGWISECSAIQQQKQSYKWSQQYLIIKPQPLLVMKLLLGLYSDNILKLVLLWYFEFYAIISFSYSSSIFWYFYSYFYWDIYMKNQITDGRDVWLVPLEIRNHWMVALLKLQILYELKIVKD